MPMVDYTDNMRQILFIAVLVIMWPLASLAVDFHIPLKCDYGKDCFIEYYFDHEEAPDKFIDYRCGNLSKDGQISTIFKLLNHSQMKKGVDVLAVDDGIIRYARSNVMDIDVKLIGQESIHGKECGNGIVIEHPRQYFTQYCHLKQGSIQVKVGEKVKRDQTIGQVGLSGNTSFPHLQLTTLKEGIPVDPFTGEDPLTEKSYVQCNSLDTYPLWDRKTELALDYIKTALLSSGFTSRVPHATGAREGKFSKKRIKENAKFLVFWVDILGIEKDDTLELEIFGPDGKKVTTKSKAFETNRRHYFEFLGKRNEETSPLKEGEYIGHARLIRNTEGTPKTILDYSATAVVFKVRQ